MLDKTQIFRYGFIVKGPGYFPDKHTAEISSEAFSTRVVGVSDYLSAILVAQQLVADGIQLIELCGGFTQSEADTLRKLAENKIVIDLVRTCYEL